VVSQWKFILFISYICKNYIIEGMGEGKENLKKEEI
jgi:hypothetical protein